MSKHKTLFMVRVFRFFRVFLWMVSLVWWANVRYQHQTEEQRVHHLKHLAGRLLSILNAQINIKGGDGPCDFHHVLVVANHISFLDAVALVYLSPMSFVAKQEIKSWPFIGKVAEVLGTVFVDRNNRKNAEYISQMMAKKLSEGHAVAFFPEARTSDDGMRVLPFKASLFQSAINSSSAIQPISIRYFDVNGDRTRVPAYYGEMSLMQCVCNILSLPTFTIQMDLLPQVPLLEVLKKDRYALKDQMEEVITDYVSQGFE